MEKKRKLPARAAARGEQAAKRRQLASCTRSPEPTPTPPSPSPPPPPPPQPSPPSLPTSIEVGKPLPTVEEPQPADLSAREYQSISESGVLAESLTRSRQKWISQGLFEKYWTKPFKRKGVLQEEPNNPPKESMSRAGHVTITIEPHIIEATMYIVKAPKPTVPQQQPSSQPAGAQPAAAPPPPPPPSDLQTPSKAPQSQLPRPKLQYGPPNGAMPPPAPAPNPAVAQVAPSPTPVPATPKPAASPAPVAKQSQPSPMPAPPKQVTPSQVAPVKPAPTTPAAQSATLPGAGPVAASPAPVSRPSVTPSANAPKAPSTQQLQQPPKPPAAAAGPQTAAAPMKTPGAPATGTGTGPALAPNRPAPTPATASLGVAPAAPKPATNDPVITLLAQRASGDSELRDLMKRVAVGQARDGELAQFQKIIDQLNIECKQRSAPPVPPGPPADALKVDGRTVKYFADEVRTILDIVLASNPTQKSSELKPPPGSDALVVLLVKTALEDQRTKDMIRRIAEGRAGPTDAQNLKETLDRLHRDAKTVPKGRPTTVTPNAKPPAATGEVNGQTKAASTSLSQPNSAQALRSKGPPPAPKQDLTAVVFDFGSGDRFLFPKYSVLEFLPSAHGQQALASFLIVRKGSTSEYGGDPNLDYYQPVTIRLSTTSGRHLDHLSRVVAPLAEVQRYMNDVMDNMTRAEYVLLAMRLPRAKGDGNEAVSGAHEDQDSTPKSESDHEGASLLKSRVLWSSSTTKPVKSPAAFNSNDSDSQDPEVQSQLEYQRLIQSVAEKNTEAE